MQGKFGFGSFSSFTGADGKKRKIDELPEYLEDRRKNGITVKTKLNVGDIVKVKGLPDYIIVKYVDYEIKGVGIVDYAGLKVGSEDTKRLSIFYQYEIEKIIKKNNKEEKEEER